MRILDQNLPVIAGPCALESRQQIKECVAVLKRNQVPILRASLWKPRTEPGWEGLGLEGLAILLEETLPNGIVPATEVLLAEQAEMMVKMLEAWFPEGNLIVWLGARNQNHLEQQKIARILASSTAPITLMFKNQMWEDEKHWLGICRHLLDSGFPKSRLMACHRGFAPGKAPNPLRLRNLPDFEMAMRVKEATGIPMLLDPSHIAGTQENVFIICEMAAGYGFDGFMVEMHSDPEKAKTDSNQQLAPAMFEKLIKMLERNCLIKKAA